MQQHGSTAGMRLAVLIWLQVKDQAARAVAKACFDQSQTKV
jgi:hypothetical protein